MGSTSERVLCDISVSPAPRDSCPSGSTPQNTYTSQLLSWALVTSSAARLHHTELQITSSIHLVPSTTLVNYYHLQGVRSNAYFKEINEVYCKPAPQQEPAKQRG